MISTISLTLDLNSKTGRVTDTTDYSGIPLGLNLYGAKGLGTISFQGTIIESKLTISDPLIDLATGDTYFDFPLELDVNGNVANGIYEVEYSLRLTNLGSGSPQSLDAVTLPSTIEVSIPEMLADFFEVGDQMTLSNFGGSQIVTIASVTYVDATQTLITFNEIIDDPAYIFYLYNITNLQADNVYTYAGCTQTEGRIGFSYDCDVAPNGTFGVSNTTVLPSGQVVSSVTANISYPSWTSSQIGFISEISNTPLPYTNNVLATGTYTVVMNQVIEQVQNDGLIIRYPANAISEFGVTCVGSLCGLNSCIENLRQAHIAELARNRISKYQPYVDNVLMYYAEAMTYRSCGDLDAYGTALANIQQTLDASGCDCGCCDEDTYRWISINSSATIDSLVEAIQYRLYTPAVSGPPLATDDITDGVQIGAIWQDTTTGILYRCTSNLENNATWAVYYNPASIVVAAVGVTSNAQIGGIVLGVNVQSNIDSINAALINNQLSITGLVTDVTDLDIFVNSLVESVSGPQVDNTDPNNPVVNTPLSTDILWGGNVNGTVVSNVSQALTAINSNALYINNTDASQIEYVSTFVPDWTNVNKALDGLAVKRYIARIGGPTTISPVYDNFGYTGTPSITSAIPAGTYLINFSVQWLDVNKSYVSIISDTTSGSVQTFRAKVTSTSQVTIFSSTVPIDDAIIKIEVYQ